MTGPPASAAARSAGSRSSIRPVTAARPCSTACPLGGSDPPGQARRGGGRQARYRGDLLARRIGALPVQPGQEILPGQLRRRDPRQQLPGAEPAIPLLDGADRGIQRLDHAEPAAQLGDRGQARIRRQRPIRRAGPHLLTPPATSTYPAHQIGVLSTGPIITWQRSSSQARAAPIGIYRVVSPAYSWNRVRAAPFVSLMRSPGCPATVRCNGAVVADLYPVGGSRCRSHTPRAKPGDASVPWARGH